MNFWYQQAQNERKYYIFIDLLKCMKIGENIYFNVKSVL